MKQAWRPIMCVMLLAAARAAAGENARDAIQRGNQHYAAGRYGEALDCYRQAASQPADRSPVLPEALHDQAAALFKLGRIDEARALWLGAKGLKDAAFEARAASTE